MFVWLLTDVAGSMYGFLLLYSCHASTLERQQQHITITDLEATVLHVVAAHCIHALSERFVLNSNPRGKRESSLGTRLAVQHAGGEYLSMRREEDLKHHSEYVLALCTHCTSLPAVDQLNMLEYHKISCMPNPVNFVNFNNSDFEVTMHSCQQYKRLFHIQQVLHFCKRRMPDESSSIFCHGSSIRALWISMTSCFKFTSKLIITCMPL